MLLNNLNPAKATGPDRTRKVLNLVSMEMAPVLCIIFQQSYNIGQILYTGNKSTLHLSSKRVIRPTQLTTDKFLIPVSFIELWIM